MTLENRLSTALEGALPAAVALRQELHRHPQVSGKELDTCGRVLQALPAGAVHQAVADTGAVARVGGHGPTIGIRAELDALPVHEQSDYPHASALHGVMHACGHDVHLAALVAVMTAIDSTDGAVPALAVLQPREETYPSGGKDIVDSAVLRRHNTIAMIGAHVHPGIAQGVVACTTGPVNASSDEFTVTVRGVDGHAAYPHMGGDAVATLCHIVVAAQSLISRMTDPMANAVLSFTVLKAGAAANAIPGVASTRGSIRAMTQVDRARIIAGLSALADQLASVYGCCAEVEFVAGEPVLTNDPAIAGRCAQLLRDNGFGVIDDHRSAGSDDFAYYCGVMPGLMMFVGSGTPSTPLHSPRFAPPDSVVGDVARAIMFGYLAAHAVAHQPDL